MNVKVQTVSRLMRTLLAAAVAIVSALAALPVLAAEEKILNILNWAEYIGADTVKKFEAETGIKVRYDTFDSNEILLAKMIARQTGYDIIVPSSDFGKVMMDGAVVARIDRTQLHNWDNLDPEVLALLARLDPGNQYMVPWLGSMIAVGYNVDKVKAALGDMPLPTDPFELVFNPAYATKLTKCGISMLDSASDIFPSALIYLKKSPYSDRPTDYQEAAEMLQKVRKHITLFSSLGYVTELANGSLCVALGYNGDFNNANLRAREGGSKVRIEAPLPPNGVQFGFESMMIPADAPHKENALKWIDFILRPEIQAEITSKVMFMSPNQAARKFMKKEALESPIVSPPREYLRTKAYMYEPRRNDIRRVMTRLFTKLKSGL